MIFFQTQTFEWNLLLPIKRTKSCSKQWFLNLSLHKNPKRSLWIPGHHLTRFLILPISGEGFWGRWPRVHQRSMDHCGLIWSSSHSEGVKQVLRGFKDLMSHDVKRPSLYVTIFQLPESFRIEFETVSNQKSHLDVLPKVNFFLKIAKRFLKARLWALEYLGLKSHILSLKGENPWVVTLALGLISPSVKWR